MPQGNIHSQGETRSAKDRARSAVELVRQFLRLLRPYRWRISGILASLTVATIVGLIPPAGTKFIVDNVLTGKPLPPQVTKSFPWASSPQRLLLATVVAVALISLLKIAIHLWGRWYATKISKQIQTNVRRRVFEHAVRLPLHREPPASFRKRRALCPAHSSPAKPT